VKTMLMVFFGALVLGFAFAGSSYFVTKEQDVLFQCYYDSTVTTNKTYNTYKTTSNGFPFAFYTKYSQPVSSSCQKPEYPDKSLSYNSDGTLAPFAQLELSCQLFTEVSQAKATLLLTIGQTHFQLVL
jgi:hypothetical protein